MPVIWAPFVPLIPFGYCSQSIDGHDLISRSSTIAKCWVTFWPPLKRREPPPALGLFARDVAELVRALVGELHQHDRLAGARVEVRARARELEIVSPHLRHFPRALCRLERAETGQVEVVLRRVDRVDARADHLADAALKDDRLRRHAEDLPALGELALRAGLLDRLALEQLSSRRDGSGAQLLLVVEQVPRRLACSA